MEQLRQRDLRAVFLFLREIHADPDLEGFATNIVSMLSKVISSEWASYNKVNPRSQKVTGAIEPVPP